jgi:anion-transporting  ArsA/GET3 family ATPase
MASLLEDPKRTGVVLCALPEETPVNETLETAAKLRDLRVDLGLVVLNRTRGTLLDDDEAEAIGALTPGAVDQAAEGGLAVRVAGPVLVEHRRARREQAQHDRLRDGLCDGVALTTLPRRDGEVTRADLGEVADALAGAAA